MNRKYPVIDRVRTGQNIKRIMQLKGLTVKSITIECIFMLRN